MSTVISICNQKGGVGKSTSSLEIAYGLALYKKKVLLIDFDQQHNLTMYVGADESMPTIFNLLKLEVEPSECIQHIKNFDFIPASAELSLADKTFADPVDDPYLLKDITTALKEDYDYIIIDNCPARNILLNMSYLASDYVILCSESDEGSLAGILAVMNDIERIKKRNPINANLLGIILTKYENTTMHAAAMLDMQNMIDEVIPKNTLSKKPFIKVVRKSIVVSETKTFRKSLQEYKKSSKPAMDYMDIVKTIEKEVK